MPAHPKLTGVGRRETQENCHSERFPSSARADMIPKTASAFGFTDSPAALSIASLHSISEDKETDEATKECCAWKKSVG